MEKPILANAGPRHLAKSTLLIGVSKGSVQVTLILLIPVYTELLSPSDYGVIELVVAYAALLAPSLLLQLDAAAFRFGLQRRQNVYSPENFLPTIWWFSFALAGCCLAIGGAIALLLSLPILALSAALISAFMLFLLAQQTVRGQGRLGLYASTNFIFGAFTVVGSVISLTVLKMGPTGILCSMGLGYVVAFLAVALSIRAWNFLKFMNFDRNALKIALGFTVPLIPNGLAWWAVDAGGRVILAVTQGLATLGLLSMANRFSSMYSQVFALFGLAWDESSALFWHDHRRESLYSNVINGFVQMSASVALLMVVTVNWYFPLLVNNAFVEGKSLVPALFFAAFLNSWAALYSPIYLVNLNSRALLLSTVIAGFISVTLTLILTPVIGAMGVVLGATLAWTVALIFRHFSVRALIKVQYYSKTWVSVGLLLVAVVCQFWFGAVLSEPYVWLIVAFIAIFSSWLNAKTLRTMISLFIRRGTDIKTRNGGELDTSGPGANV